MELKPLRSQQTTRRQHAASSPLAPAGTVPATRHGVVDVVSTPRLVDGSRACPGEGLPRSAPCWRDSL